MLVHAYWQCLDPTLSRQELQQLESARSERAARLYSDASGAAALCAAAGALTLLGLSAVCTAHARLLFC